MITTPWDLIDKIKSLNYFRSAKSIIGAFFDCKYRQVDEEWDEY